MLLKLSLLGSCTAALAAVLDGSAVSQLTARTNGRQATVPVFESNNFWFANFSVGDADGLALLLDTGSTNVVIQPGLYKPSKHSVNTGQNFTVAYDTTGVNGTGTAMASGEVYLDRIGLEGTSLMIANYSIDDVTHPKSPPPFPNAHAGLLGLGNVQTEQTNITWVELLCKYDGLEECRFGMAFGTEGKGHMTIGSLDQDLVDGNLSTVELPSKLEWVVLADIAANDKVIEHNATIIMDTGTPNIFGPRAAVRRLFEQANVQIVETPGTNVTGPLITGYYNCSHPPQLGFAFPPASQAGQGPNSAKSTIFNVLPQPLAQYKSGHNCTAVISGTDAFGDAWIVGQPLYQGHYVDHNIKAKTMSFASLKV